MPHLDARFYPAANASVIPQTQLNSKEKERANSRNLSITVRGKQNQGQTLKTNQLEEQISVYKRGTEGYREGASGSKSPLRRTRAEEQEIRGTNFREKCIRGGKEKGKNHEVEPIKASKSCIKHIEALKTQDNSNQRDPRVEQEVSVSQG